MKRAVLASMDPSVDPCQDFYRYSCGGWLDSNEIPSDQTRWTRSFSVLRESNREVLREILQDAAADPGADRGRFDQRSTAVRRLGPGPGARCRPKRVHVCR